MAISIKDSVIREITTMVRKGTIQFDMNDRPVLDLNRTDRNTGKKISYCVGSIGRDEETSGLSYTLYTTDGTFVPSAKGPRSIESLYNRELVAVRDCVSKYFDMSINRSKNLRDILESVKLHSDGMEFNSGVKPSAFVDLEFSGSLAEVRIDSIYFPDPSVSSDSRLMFSGSDLSGGKVVGLVQSLNDRALANIVTCLGLERKISLSGSESEKMRTGERKSSGLGL